MNRTGMVAAAIAVALVIAGCGASGSDKAGGGHRKPVVLSMAIGYGEPGELQSFADEVAKRSDGGLRVKFARSWREGQRNYEVGLIRDVTAGKVDLGAAGSRAWSAVGVGSFDALHAPFSIDSYALERAVFESRIPQAMLKGLQPLGLVGIGVLPGPLSHPVSDKRPLAGNQAAIEQSASISVHSYETFATRYLTANVTLWPRPTVLFMGERAFASLSPTQRALLRDAANAAIPAALADVRAQERFGLAALCRRQIDLVIASQADIRVLRAAASPVLDGLRRSPETRSFMASIETLRGRQETTGERPLACPDQAGPSASGIPDGTYTTTITRDDIARAGLPPEDVDAVQAGSHFDLVLKAGGFALYETRPGGRRELGFEGTYSLYRDRFVGSGSFGDVVRARWSFDGTHLTFTDVSPKHSPYSLTWGSRPWTRRSP